MSARKLSDTQRLEVLDALARGVAGRDLAVKYGVNDSVISRIKTAHFGRRVKAPRRYSMRPLAAHPAAPPFPAAAIPAQELPGRLPPCETCGYLRDALGHIWACRRRR
jgi:hypothetical protein